MAMTLMNSYKEKGYLVRRIVFVHSILLYNSMSNFTDHEFDKEGSIRKVCRKKDFKFLSNLIVFSNQLMLVLLNLLVAFLMIHLIVNH
jgi:hypothetical protein